MKNAAKPSKAGRPPQTSEILEPVVDDFPLDLVAKTAASLLRDDDYECAVNRAFLLLQECTRQIQERERKRVQAGAEEMRKHIEIASEQIRVTDFICRLTGQTNSSRARERFKECLPWANYIFAHKTIQRGEARKLEAEYGRAKPKRRADGDKRSLCERFLADDDERLSRPPKNSDKK